VRTQSAHNVARMLCDGQVVHLVLKLCCGAVCNQRAQGLSSRSMMARLYLSLLLSFALIGCAAGPKRRKVVRTAINDRGEEVTEEVWEDSQDASTPEEQDEQADARQPQVSAAKSPVSKSPEKALQDDALKEQPGQCSCWENWTVSVMSCMD